MSRKGSKRPLKARNFIYDLVEETNQTRKPDMEVILTAFVDGIGHKGETVTVRPNFAYNKLLLPGLAVYKTPENIAKYENKESNDANKHSSPFIQRTISVFWNRIVHISMNSENPWVLQPWHVRVSMRKAGLYVLDDAAIELPKEPITGPDFTKNSKEFICTVTINNLEKAKVRCRIHHWSTDAMKRMPYVFEHWKQPAELLFPNDETQQIDANPVTPPVKA